MAEAIQFPYRPKTKVVLAIVLFWLVCLGFLAGLAYIYVYDRRAANDLFGSSGGKAILGILFASAFAILIPVYLIVAHRAILRLTDSELIVGPRQRLAIREISGIRVTGERQSRTMYVHAAEKRYALIGEDMLPNSQAFDQILQALYSRGIGNAANRV